MAHKKSDSKPSTTKVTVAETRGWQGKVRITVLGAPPGGDRPRRSGGRVLDRVDILDEVELGNLITDAGRDLMALAMRDATALPEISWVALGDDATAPVVGDTALGNEVFRKLMTTQVAGATGVSVSTVYIAPGEANQQLEEIGWYAGTATSAPGSGTLIARVLYSRLKDALESIQIERTDTIS